MTTLTVLVLLGFVLIASLLVYLTVRNAAQWRQKLDDILLPIGFAPVASPSERATLEQALSIVNTAHRGKRLLKFVYRRAESRGPSVTYVCDYYFGSGSGKARGGTWLLVCLISEALRLPRFSVHTLPESAGPTNRRLFRLLAQTREMPGLHRIPIGDAALEERFMVYAQDKHAALPLQGDLLHSLGNSAGGSSLDAGGNTLVLSNIGMMADRIRQVLDPQKLQAQIHLAGRIFTTVTA